MSIKDEVLKRLVGNRALTSAEMAEIDSMGAAMNLDVDDPLWGLVLWGWAKFPRFDSMSIHLQAIDDAAKSLADATMDRGKSEVQVDTQEIVKAVTEAMANAPQKPAVAVDNEVVAAAVRKSVAESLNLKFKQAGQIVSAEQVAREFKEMVGDLVSYASVVIISLIAGLVLFGGVQLGEAIQYSHDGDTVAAAQKQLSDMIAGRQSQSSLLQPAKGK